MGRAPAVRAACGQGGEVAKQHKKVKNRLRRGFLTYCVDYEAILFELNLSTSFFELFLEAFGVSLSKTFLNNRRSAVYEFLSFLEAKAGELFHELNYCELACAGVLKNYVERRLFFFSGGTGSGAGCYCYSCSCGFDTILVFEDLSEFVNFFNGKVYQLFCKSFEICHCCIVLICF